MRGDERVQDELFRCVTLEQRVPQGHPLREIRKLTDAVLVSLNDAFDLLYAVSGRPSIAPEYVLRALLLQAFYSVRSERQLVEQLDYNLLFRWFVGLGMDDAVWNHAVFSKNRDRLLTSEVAQRFFAEVNRLAKRFMSDEHFTVDGTLIQAWASQKSFRRKDGSDDDGTNFRGQKRSDETHQSTTDPESRLYRKSYGKESKLAYLGHALVENRNGLIASAMATQADGHAERDAALLMLNERQTSSSQTHHGRRRQGLRHERLHRRSPCPQRHGACTKERKRPPLQPRQKNHTARRLRALTQSPMADRKDLRLAEADRTAGPGEAARTGQGRLGLRLQLRRPQPAAPASAHRKPDRAKPAAEVRLKSAESSQPTLK